MSRGAFVLGTALLIACASSDGKTPGSHEHAPSSSAPAASPPGAAVGWDMTPYRVDACFTRMRACRLGLDAEGGCPVDRRDEWLAPAAGDDRRCGCSALSPHGSECVAGCIPTGVETCNGRDDDCDGVVDNIAGTQMPLVEACADFPAELAGIGQCRKGWRACGGGSFGACEGQRRPEPERCDGADNDCDGFVDNPTPGQPGHLIVPCAASMLGDWCGGVQECVGGRAQIDGDATACAFDRGGRREVRRAVTAYQRVGTTPPELVCPYPSSPTFPLCPFGSSGEGVDEAFLESRFAEQSQQRSGPRDRAFFTVRAPGSHDVACETYPFDDAH